MRYKKWQDWDEDDKAMREKRDKKIERGNRIIELAHEEYDIWFHIIHQKKTPSRSRREEANE